MGKKVEKNMKFNAKVVASKNGSVRTGNGKHYATFYLNEMKFYARLDKCLSKL